SGYLSQDSDLAGGVTVRGYLEYAGWLKGIPAQQCEVRADEILNNLDLSPVAKLKISKLSGGMRRRMQFGAEMMANPDILLLDEPTTGLDSESREHFNGIL